MISGNAGTSGTITIDGLTNGLNYWFRVRALTSSGEGAFALVTATPMATAPNVLGLGATPGDGTVVLTWSVPADTGGLAVVGYRIERCTTGVAYCPIGSAGYATNYYTVVTANTGNALTSYTAYGLTNGTEIWFRVTPLTQAGGVAIAGGSPATISAVPSSTPSGPIDLKITNTGTLTGRQRLRGPRQQSPAANRSPDT